MEGDLGVAPAELLDVISIHALRVEGDPSSTRDCRGLKNFYPRPPGGGRPGREGGNQLQRPISIHALRVEGDFFWCKDGRIDTAISIHALRVEGDCSFGFDILDQDVISIHALRVEGDYIDTEKCYQILYISIHALRVEGDAHQNRINKSLPYFYPRPPGGGRRRVVIKAHDPISISIHALRVEGDLPQVEKGKAYGEKFLSTPSGWRATTSKALKKTGRRNFYPRPPGGGRPHQNRINKSLPYFYPRPPGGGRRRVVIKAHDPISISIHALRVEGDLPQVEKGKAYGEKFLSTPSGWRATTSKALKKTGRRNFYPRPPGGGRPHQNRINKSLPYFYPRPPGGGRQQKRTKFSSVFAKKGEEFASLRRGKRKICRWRFKKDKFWVLIWCEGSRKSVCALASHCG